MKLAKDGLNLRLCCLTQWSDLYFIDGFLSTNLDCNGSDRYCEKIKNVVKLVLESIPAK